MDLESRRSLRAAVIGMALGDGHISSRYTLAICHCLRQEPYLTYKAELLMQLQPEPIKIKFFINDGYPTVRLETRKRSIYRRLRHLLYSRQGKKYVTREVLEYLDLRAIAIWFMDDGSVSPKFRRGKVHACELTLNTYVSLEENETIISYFAEVWGLQFGLNKSKGSWRLRMGTREGRRFIQLIEPYIVPSMEYKIKPLLA